MRIIGGSRRGQRLRSPRNRSIRPTADRVRESIFNILAGGVADSRVLDLFAGTGAMGLEALSRGAEYAVFIDKQPAALTLIQKNIEICRWHHRSQVIRWDPIRNLNCLGQSKEPFNLVFIDPPYRKQMVEIILRNLDRSNAVATKATIVVEHVRDEIIKEETVPFILEDQRRYGKTLVSFFRYML